MRNVNAYLELRRKSRIRWLVAVMLSCLSIIVLTHVVADRFVKSYQARREGGRFDLHLPQAEAERIRDEALRRDDGETYVAIQKDRIIEEKLAKFDVTLGMAWSHFRNTQSIAKTFELFELARRRRDANELQLWQNVLDATAHLRSNPRTIEMVAHQYGELWRKAVGLPDIPEQFNGLVAGMDLSKLYERQGRIGESIDYRLYAAISMSVRSWLIAVMKYTLESDRLMIDRYDLRAQFKATPNDPWLIRLNGLSYWHSKDFGKAEPLLAVASERFDDDPLGRFAWAQSRLELRLPIDPALIMGSRCRDSVHFETQESTRLTFRAKLYVSKSEFEKAVADLVSATVLDPRNAEAWTMLADLHGKRGNGSDASEADAIAARLWAERRRLESIVRSASKIQHPVSRYETKLQDPVLLHLEHVSRQTGWDLPADILTKIRERTSAPDRKELGDLVLDFRPPFPDRYFLPRPVLRPVTMDSMNSGAPSK
jgi:tetratricopeptide (TPR) repeat protein